MPSPPSRGHSMLAARGLVRLDARAARSTAMSRMSASHPALALLVGGGPAPGINGVISAATIEARNRGVRVIGVLDGFEWLAAGRHRPRAAARDPRRLAHPLPRRLDPAHLAHEPDQGRREARRTWSRALRALGVRYLVTIGGDDTAFSRQPGRRAGRRRAVGRARAQDDRQRPAAAGRDRRRSASRRRDTSACRWSRRSWRTRAPPAAGTCWSRWAARRATWRSASARPRARR